MGNPKLNAALAQLDPANDDHWTNAGLPLLKAVEGFMGEDVTREYLQEHGPEGFERDTAKSFELEAPEAPEAPEDQGKPDQSAITETQKKVEAAMAEPEEPDAFALIEAFVAAVNTERFSRNTELQAISRMWQIHQKPARDIQDRIDKRAEMRAKAQALADQ